MSRLQANLLLLCAALIWGTTFIVQQTVLTHMGPISFTSARFLIGALAVLPFALAEWRRLRADGGVPRRTWAAMVGTGCALFAGAVLQQLGIGLTTVTNASFLTALYVPLVPILTLLVTRIAPAPVVWPAALACLAGTWLMSGAHSLTAVGQGDLLVVLGAVFWAGHVFLVGLVGSRAPLLLAMVQFLVCSLLAGGTAAAVEDFQLAQLGSAWFELAYAGLLSCGIAFTLQVVAQRHTAASDAAIIFSSEAVFATIAGMILLAERPTSAILAGCAIITIAALAVQLVPSRKEAPAA